MPDELKELTDKRKLDELVYRTMHAMDEGDWKTYRAAMLDDAQFDFSSHNVVDEVSDLLTGADTFVGMAQSVLAGFDAVQHHVTNMFHTLDGDVAETNCYVYAEHFLNNDLGDRSISVGARYRLTCRRQADDWKIAKWVLKVAWYRGNPMLYGLAKEVAERKAKSA